MNQFLLDTNIVLWLSEDNPRISQIKPLLFSGSTQVSVSVVSWWEIAMKLRAGKLYIDFWQLRFLAKNHKLHELPLTSDSMKAYLKLPIIHKDPFDHMLLAQAISSPMRFITGDAVLAGYSPLVMVI